MARKMVQLELSGVNILNFKIFLPDFFRKKCLFHFLKINITLVFKKKTIFEENWLKKTKIVIITLASGANQTML
jgi:hypothetical protein